MKLVTERAARRTVAAAAALLAAQAAAAATWTYDVALSGACTNACVGTIDVLGTITVDTLGAIDATAVTDFSLTLSSSNYAATVLSPANGEAGGFGTYTLMATPTALTLSLPAITDPGSGGFFIRDTLAFPYVVGVQWQGGDGLPFQQILTNAPVSDFLTDPFDQSSVNLPASEPLVLGTLTPVPLPAGLALLLGGLGALGAGAGLRRMRAA